MTRRGLEVLATLTALLAAWWGYVTLFSVPVFLLPPPERVGRAAWTLIADGDLWPHLASTAGVGVAGVAPGPAGRGALGGGFAQPPAPRRRRRRAAPLLH